MREIKFRAWDKRFPSISNYSDQYGSLASFFGDFDREDIELMQYTGLLDKNGKEIYEGDVLKAQYKDSTIVDNKGFAKDKHEEVNKIIIVTDIFTLRDVMGGTYQGGGHWHYPFLEVIGNIYENPELMLLH